MTGPARRGRASRTPRAPVGPRSATRCATSCPSGRPAGGSGGAHRRDRAAVLDAPGARSARPRRWPTSLVEGRRVRGVTLAGGEEVGARAVVVACDPRVPAGALARRRRRAESPGYERWRRRSGQDGYQSKLDAVVAEPPRYRAVDPEAARAPRRGRAPRADDGGGARPPRRSPLRTARCARVGSPPGRRTSSTSPRSSTRRCACATGEHVLSLEALFTPYGAGRVGWSGQPRGARALARGARDAWRSRGSSKACAAGASSRPPTTSATSASRAARRSRYGPSPLTAVLGPRAAS